MLLLWTLEPHVQLTFNILGKFPDLNDLFMMASKTVAMCGNMSLRIFIDNPSKLEDVLLRKVFTTFFSSTADTSDIKKSVRYIMY